MNFATLAAAAAAPSKLPQGSHMLDHVEALADFHKVFTPERCAALVAELQAVYSTIRELEKRIVDTNVGALDRRGTEWALLTLTRELVAVKDKTPDKEIKRSVIYDNASANPNYCPFCLQCGAFERMQKIETMFWKCKNCKAEHDERVQA